MKSYHITAGIFIPVLWKRAALPFLMAVIAGLGMISHASAQQLLMEYTMDAPPNSGTSSVVADYSGNGRDATVYTGTVANGGVGIPSPLGTNAGISGEQGDYSFLANTTPYGSSLIYSGTGFGTLSSFTVCGWFKTNTTSTFATSSRFMELDASTWSNSILVLAPSPGNWQLQIGGTAVGTTTGGAYNQTQQWIFLAVTYDSTNHNVHFYKGLPNGSMTLVSSSTGTNINPVTVTGSTKVTWGNGNGGDSRTFLGYMDDLRIYGAATGSSGALGLDALAQVAAAANPALWDRVELLMEYNLNTPPNSGTSSVVADVSGNGRDATVYTGTVANGGVGIPAPLGTHAGVSTATGDGSFQANTTPGSSLIYNGTGFGTLSSFTVCGWFNTNRTSTFTTATRFLELDGSTSILVLAPNPGDWELQLSGTPVALTTGSAFKQTQQWIFLALTYDSMNQKVNFYRGLPSGSMTLVSSTTCTSLSPVSITGAMKVTWGNNGSTDDSRVFPGYLDDLRIYGAVTGSAGALGVNALSQIAVTAGSAATWSVVNLEPTLGTDSAGYALLTQGGYQFAAYYDANGQMSVAQRQIKSGTGSEVPSQYPWTIKKLNSTWAGFDAHNYVTMALDSNHCLHVSGNMHAVPLCYFRASQPYDVNSLTQQTSMTTQNPENSVTYPIFLKDTSGNLIFTYRNGSSGDGDQYYNIYNATTGTWSSLLAEPLFDGTTQDMSAYAQTPLMGPDGYYHTAWVWRNTPDVATNHDLSYMRSPDLVNWQTISGTALALSVTPSTQGVVVDPIPVNGGIINGCQQVGFDPSNNVVISYLKYDENGYSQIYLARYVNGAWLTTKATNWTYRWVLSGGGTIASQISIGPVISKNGQMTIRYNHVQYGSHTAIVDPVNWTLDMGNVSVPADTTMPGPFYSPGSTFPGVAVRRVADLSGTDAAYTYVLRSESVSNPGDLFYVAPYSPPWMLQVIGSPKAP